VHDLTLDAPTLRPHLETRADPERSPAEVAARDLARYYGLLARELAALRFTKAEGVLLHHAHAAAQSAREEGEPFASFSAAVEYEWRRTCGMHTVQAAHGDELAERVAAFTPAQTLAVLDACERFRVLVKRDGWTDIPVMLRAVGLLREG
jgi:hypothetical protein